MVIGKERIFKKENFDLINTNEIMMEILKNVFILILN